MSTDRQIELGRRFGEAGGGRVSFPSGEELLPPTPFVRELLGEIDTPLLDGGCPDGRLELATPEVRLICANGTRVAGKAIETHRLAGGEVIEIEEGGDFRLTCLAGGSTRVNGREVRDARLAFGDRLSIGRTVLRLERPGSGSER